MKITPHSCDDWREHPETVAWRTGKHPEEGRGIYAVQPGRAFYQQDHDVLLGFMDTDALASVVVRDHNAAVGHWPPKRGDRGATVPGGPE